MNKGSTISSVTRRCLALHARSITLHCHCTVMHGHHGYCPVITQPLHGHSHCTATTHGGYIEIPLSLTRSKLNQQQYTLDLLDRCIGWQHQTDRPRFITQEIGCVKCDDEDPRIQEHFWVDESIIQLSSTKQVWGWSQLSRYYFGYVTLLRWQNFRTHT